MSLSDPLFIPWDRDFTIYFMVNMQKTVERLKDLQFFNGKLMISLAMFHRMPKV